MSRTVCLLLLLVLSCYAIVLLIDINHGLQEEIDTLYGQIMIENRLSCREYCDEDVGYSKAIMCVSSCFRKHIDESAGSKRVIMDVD